MFQPNSRNFYHLLQVQLDASPEIIKASYRTIMGKLKFHPDLGGSPNMAILINEAYEVLSDPMQRARYDKVVLRNVSQPHLSVCRPKAVFYGYPPGPLSQRNRPNLKVAKAQGLTYKKEQRSAPRILQPGQLIYFLASHSQGFHGECVDFSPTGLRFRCPSRLEIGQIFQIRSSLLLATVKTTNCRRDGATSNYFCGVVFLSVEFIEDRGQFISLTA